MKRGVQREVTITVCDICGFDEWPQFICRVCGADICGNCRHVDCDDLAERHCGPAHYCLRCWEKMGPFLPRLREADEVSRRAVQSILSDWKAAATKHEEPAS